MNMSITISTVSTLITPAGRNLKMRLKSLFENYEGFAVSNVANAREHVLPVDYFAPHFQFRISGRSSPCFVTYCLCSMSLSRMACLA